MCGKIKLSRVHMIYIVDQSNVCVQDLIKYTKLVVLSFSTLFLIITLVWLPQYN